MDLDQKPVRISSTQLELFISADDLAGLLKVSANELSYLTRSKIIVRQPDPYDSRAYVYPVWENVTRYIVWLREKREAMRMEFLKEKALTQREQRIRLELQNGVSNGRLVEKEKILRVLEPAAVAFKNVLLTRAGALERAISATKGRKARIAAIQQADLELFTILSEIFKPLYGRQNGSAHQSSGVSTSGVSTKTT